MLPWSRGRPLNRAWRTTEPRRWSRLDNTVNLNERPALTVMGMIGCLLHAEHRGKAHFAPFHTLAPLLARLRLEDPCHPLLQPWPCRTIILTWQFFLLQSAQSQQFRVELGL